MFWQLATAFTVLSGALQGLLSGFAGDAHGGHRPGDEPFFADFSAAEFAVAIGAVIDALHGLPDLGDELALPVPDSQGEIAVGFQGGPVRGVGEGATALVMSVLVLSASPRISSGVL